MLEDSWTVVPLDNQRCLLSSAPLLLNCIEKAGSSHDAGELLIPAWPALELADPCLVFLGLPSSSTQFSSRPGARRS